MKKSVQQPQKGHLLISEPFLNDDYFKRSVILLAENSASGSLGFILNKPLGYFLHELIKNFPESEFPVYLGGPVENNSLFFIHRLPQLIPNGFYIHNGWYYGGDFKQVKQAVALGLIKQNDIRFFAGYSGWDPGQLDHELKTESWFVFNQPDDFIKLSTERMWGEILRINHSEMAIWSNFPDDPTLN